MRHALTTKACTARILNLIPSADLQKPGSPDLEKKKPKVARRMTGKCWMAEDFPMSLTQLLPVLEVIGNANKHIARVAKFLHKYGDMSLFPVKLQVRPQDTQCSLLAWFALLGF